MIKLRSLPLYFILMAATLGIGAQSSSGDQAIRRFFANADVAWNNHDAHQLTNPQKCNDGRRFHQRLWRLGEGHGTLRGNDD